MRFIQFYYQNSKVIRDNATKFYQTVGKDDAASKRTIKEHSLIVLTYPHWAAIMDPTAEKYDNNYSFVHERLILINSISASCRKGEKFTTNYDARIIGSVVKFRLKDELKLSTEMQLIFDSRAYVSQADSIQWNVAPYQAHAIINFATELVSALASKNATTLNPALSELKGVL